MTSVEHRPPARVVWLFAPEDESLARELLRFSSVLAGQGLIQNWSASDILAGQDWRSAVVQHLRSADVIMVLISADFLANEIWLSWPEMIAVRNEGRTRVVPVLLRPTLLPAELSELSTLPRDGKAISARPNRDEAFLEVIRGLQEIVTFRPTKTETDHVVAPSPAIVAAHQTVDDIFQLDGLPRITNNHRHAERTRWLDKAFGGITLDGHHILAQTHQLLNDAIA
ncbi:MAG: toll/interleukin-1 receptor domain-containing protein, partial [Minicystis sp.]